MTMYIKKVLGFFPYRAYHKTHVHTGNVVFSLDYDLDSKLVRLQRDLANEVGEVDNHSGWMVETVGGVFFFGFSDWVFTISTPVSGWEKMSGFRTIPKVRR